MIKIEVTQEDIDKGKPDNIRSCPVARAISRKLGVTASVWGLQANWQAYNKGVDTIFSARLSDSALLKIRKYDKTGKMTPFNFMLDDPR